MYQHFQDNHSVPNNILKDILRIYYIYKVIMLTFLKRKAHKQVEDKIKDKKSNELNYLIRKQQKLNKRKTITRFHKFN